MSASEQEQFDAAVAVAMRDAQHGYTALARGIADVAQRHGWPECTQWNVTGGLGHNAFVQFHDEVAQGRTLALATLHAAADQELRRSFAGPAMTYSRGSTFWPGMAPDTPQGARTAMLTFSSELEASRKAKGLRGKNVIAAAVEASWQRLYNSACATAYRQVQHWQAVHLRQAQALQAQADDMKQDAQSGALSRICKALRVAAGAGEVMGLGEAKAFQRAADVASARTELLGEAAECRLKAAAIIPVHDVLRAWLQADPVASNAHPDPLVVQVFKAALAVRLAVEAPVAPAPGAP